jgi:hypothetical protein
MIRSMLVNDDRLLARPALPDATWIALTAQNAS